jgi:hypothetical protein
MTWRAEQFTKANRESPVVYGSAIGDGGKGAMYRLADDRTFTLTAVECAMVKPRWAFEEAAA